MARLRFYCWKMNFMLSLLATFAACMAEDDFKICPCHSTYTPVCGDDGLTYINSCHLICAQKFTTVRAACNKACPCGRHLAAETSTPTEALNKDFNCGCATIDDPVCGNDGRTYRSACQLGCIQKFIPGLIELCKGECPCKQPSSCICTADYVPVCGNDGKTYSNLCRLICAQKLNSRLMEVCKGECPCLSCICTADYVPVCGNDGKTYSNLCQLICAQKSNPWLVEMCKGECPCNQPSSCFCTKLHDPVCGSDGKTYSNPCLLGCAQKLNSNLRLSCKGNCPCMNFPCKIN